MDQFLATGIFLFILFFLLGTGVWVGLALMGVAFVGMELFTSRPTGDIKAAQAPCNTLAAVNCIKLSLMPQSNEASVKPTIATANTLREP